jgi:hypothetical protein
MAARVKKDKPLTEGEMVDLLRARYEQTAGNGIAGTLIPQVRDNAGFDAKRTIDALGVSFWPSRGLLLDAYECKSSRSDWQAELANPAKAEQFCQRVDRFWMVAGRADLILEDEVPPDWGLLVPRGGKLVQVRPAKLLHDDESQAVEMRRRARALPPGFDRGFLIALVRQASAVATITPQEIAAARDEGFAAGEQHAKVMGRNFKDLYDRQHADVAAFQQACGVPLSGWSWRDQDAAAVGAAVKMVLNGEHEVAALERRLRSLLEAAEAIREATQGQLDACSPVAAVVA